ncbi:MAG: NAD(P)-dependent oxidoreductase, partial [Parvibaculaceae bacterium]
MVIVDRALSKREQDGKPINVAIVGAGVTGKMIALQLLTPITGIRLAAIANRTPSKAMQAYAAGGVDADIVSTLSEFEDRVAQG